MGIAAAYIGNYQGNELSFEAKPKIWWHGSFRHSNHELPIFGANLNKCYFLPEHAQIQTC